MVSLLYFVGFNKMAEQVALGNLLLTQREVNEATKNAVGELAAVLGLQTTLQQIEPFSGNPKNCKTWISDIEKAVLVANLASDGIPRIAYQTCKGLVSQYIG